MRLKETPVIEPFGYLCFVDVVVGTSVWPTNDHDNKVRTREEAEVVNWRSQAIRILSEPTRKVNRQWDDGHGR